ncbi:hypothetical protein ACWGI8_28720, partial [Streptomyces sp. NPDC054841]
MTDTGAKVLGQLRANSRTPVLTRHSDGSYLSVIGTVPVRIVEAQITVTCKDGSIFAGSYRLLTTLTDARRYPAPALVALYHQRWEHESAYYALRHTLLQGRVLCSGDPAGVEQEMWALLTLYQALRTLMVEAAQSRPGTDPDRCGLTTALQTARDLVIQAAGITTPTARAEHVGGIGQRVLAGLLPPRRPRMSTRKVKSPISRYNERQDDGRPDVSRTVTSLGVAILEPEPDLPSISPTTATPARRPPQAARLGPPPHGPRPPLAHPRPRPAPRRRHPGTWILRVQENGCPVVMIPKGCPVIPGGSARGVRCGASQGGGSSSYWAY